MECMFMGYSKIKPPIFEKVHSTGIMVDNKPPNVPATSIEKQTLKQFRVHSSQFRVQPRFNRGSTQLTDRLKFEV